VIRRITPTYPTRATTVLRTSPHRNPFGLRWGCTCPRFHFLFERGDVMYATIYLLLAETRQHPHDRT